MMRRIHFLLLGLFLMLLLPAQALAAEPRQGDVVVVGPNETIDDDLYAVGGTITIQGTVNGDVIAAGGTIAVAGVVNGDLLASGGTITVSGQVRGSVRAAGGNLMISGPVGEDVVAAGGMVDIAPNASVGRDVLLGAGSATIASQIGRNVSAGGGNLTLSGPVGGDVRAEVGTLRLTDRATVGGNLRYTSNQEAAIASGATVRGQVERSISPADSTRDPLGWAGSIALRWLRRLVGLFILGLLLVWIFPEFSRGAVQTLGSAPWRSLGLGVVLLIGVPIIALILLLVGLIVGGWWLGLVGLALFGIALVLGYIVAGLRLGRWVLAWSGRPQAHLILALLIGMVLLTLLGLVPYVGFVVALLAVLFGMGALVRALVSTRQMATAAAL